MQPPRSRLFRLARWLLPALLLLALALHLGRGLPRRVAEKQLAAALGGTVSIAAIDWPRGGVFVLHGVAAEGPALLSPALLRARIERVEARAGWRQLFGGRVDHLALFGLAAEIDPTRPLLPAPAAEGEAAIPFATLEVAPGAALVLRGARGEELASARVRAELAGRPGFPGTFAASLSGFDLADLEILMPLDLPAAARRQLAGLALGAIEVEGSSTPEGLELAAGNAAWQEAVFVLRGESLEARLRGLDLAALSSPGAPVLASGRVDLAASGTLAAGRVELTFTPARFSFAPLAASPAAGSATERQTAELGGARLAARFTSLDSGIRLEVERLEAELLAASAVPAEARSLLPLALAWQGAVDLGGRSARGRGELRSRPLGSFPFDGAFSVAAGLDLEVATPELPVARLLALLPERPEGVAARGSLSARARLRGQPATVEAAALLKFRGLEPLPQLAELQGESRVRWSAARPLAVTVESFAATGSARLPIEGLAPQPIDLRLRGAADLAGDLAAGKGRHRFEVRDLALATGKLGRLTGEITLSLPADDGLGGAGAEGAFELSGIAVPSWLGALGMEPPAGGMSFTGNFAAAPSLSKKPGQPWQARGGFRLEGAGFASAAGDRVLEGLDVEGDFEGEAAADLATGSAYSLRASGKSGGFQLLWGTLFGDFSAARPSVTARLSGRIGQNPGLEARIEPGGGLELVAALDPERRYRLSLAAADLEAARREWLAPLFAAAAPMRLAGRLQLEAAGELPSRPGAPFSARGRLELHGGELRSEGLQAEGVELSLPFDLRAADGVYSGPRLAGRLAARRIAMGRFELPPLASRLWVEADAVGLEEALEAPFAGGRLRLEKVAAGQIFAADPRLETAIRFDGISLAELFATAGMAPLEGRVDGSLPRVVVQGQRLEVEGGGRIALFGGEVEVGGISGSDVFSAYPRLRLSARFREIDLGLITRRFDFGEMHGIVEGELENLEIFRNVPLSFAARLVSVERKGVKQSIDVKAVQNLTILGTGASSNVFDKGIQRFFKRYNYAALGISARLGNDVLLLRGLEHRDGKELFLRGRLPFSIDVVNAQPGKTVSFLAMVRRLKSLDLGGARIEP